MNLEISRGVVQVGHIPLATPPLPAAHAASWKAAAHAACRTHTKCCSADKNMTMRMLLPCCHALVCDAESHAERR